MRYKRWEMRDEKWEMRPVTLKALDETCDAKGVRLDNRDQKLDWYITDLMT